ncbi:PAS domain-containing protein [Bacteroides sp. 214]|uniref:sensor histidine kinase n=1 Tax=Bacteroides sp. 214 TaxID=2302935 RepID=UPI0013D2929C|nr:ATP-binding protein [Bacteroides sp. 214]NDW12424.1 PAS domain-containing protein [Bacteroides sp. 214]
MKQFFVRILPILFIFLTYSLSASSAKSKFEVLFIQSYTERDTWSPELIDGLAQGFEDNSIPVNITTEYLNSRFWNWHGEEELMRRFCRKASERGVDLIVVSNDEALYSLLTCADSLVTKVPIVFLGVEFPNHELMEKFPNVTGMTSKPAYDVLLEVAQTIFPNRKKVVTLAEDNVLGRKATKLLNTDWEAFVAKNPDYEIKNFDITNDPMTDILFDIQLSQTAHQSVIIAPYWGLYMPSLTKVAKSPTFTVCATGLYSGVFCTVAPNAFEDAHRAADIASKILQGATPASFPITESPYELVFDYSQLTFFNIPKERLPKGSILVDEPYMEKYGTIIILFYALIIGLLIVLIIRLFTVYRRESRRRMHAQTKLLIQNRMVSQRDEFDNVFHSIRNGVVTYDSDYRVHFINKAMLQMLELSVEVNTTNSRPYEGQLGTDILALVSNGEDILLQLLKRVNNEGVSLEIPEGAFLQNKKTGKYFPVLGDIVPIRSHGKQTGIALTVRDISKEALQKQFFNLAIEESSIYPWQFDLKERVLSFASGYVERVGLNSSTATLEEIRQKIHPEDYEATAATFWALVETNLTTARITVRLRNATHKYEWWEFRMSMLEGLNEETPYNMVGVAQSVQRFKTTEEELVLARDKALEADRLKSAFLANMSHEIRTPLNAIVGFSDLLKDIHMFSEEDVAQFIATINKNCELLLALINDILDLSRVEAGTMDFQFKQYSMPVVMQEVYDSQRLNMPPGVQLVLQIPENSEKRIVTDQVRLKQVINNLINNAAKFTTEGSITFGYLEDEPGFTTFFVEDTGMGISKENLERIFDRFFKADSFSQGAGLGLSISQTIVARLRGKMGATSELGKGTRFTVRIPDQIDHTSR